MTAARPRWVVSFEDRPATDPWVVMRTTHRDVRGITHVEFGPLLVTDSLALAEYRASCAPVEPDARVCFHIVRWPLIGFASGFRVCDRRVVVVHRVDEPSQHQRVMQRVCVVPDLAEACTRFGDAAGHHYAHECPMRAGSFC